MHADTAAQNAKKNTSGNETAKNHQKDNEFMERINTSTVFSHAKEGRNTNRIE